MSLFAPRTFSTDWEHLVFDRLQRCVNMQKQMGFAEQLNIELGLPIGVDKESLEFPLGINHSFAELQGRITRTTDRARELLRVYDLELFTAGSHPVERAFCSSHVHVGTLLDETAGIYLENQVLPYIPAFSALAANAPVAFGMYLEYKSYRIRWQALGNIRPGMWRDPFTAQRVWGDDASPKLNLSPTFEVRAIDCASSRRLLAELATFVAAFIQTQGERPDGREPDPQAYLEYLINRWTAAKYGMQATFRWHGKPRPVAELLDEMLDGSAKALAALGAARRDFPLIELMLRKRICQADAVIPLAARYPDPYLLAPAWGKLLRDWDWFDNYLENASPLEPLPMLSDPEIDLAHLEAIGEGTHFYRVREVMSLPPPACDAVIARLLAASLISKEYTPERGLTLSRVPVGKVRHG